MQKGIIKCSVAVHAFICVRITKTQVRFLIGIALALKKCFATSPVRGLLLIAAVGTVLETSSGRFVKDQETWLIW